MKTKPSKRLNASLAVLVTAVCLTLATLGWRTPTIAHEVFDPDLQKKLEAKVLESVELRSARVEEAIAYLKAQLLELDVNIVLLRGAQQAQEMDRTRTQRFMLDHMIKEQRNATEEARLKMLDLSERYRIVESGLDLASLRLKQSEENTLSKEMAIATEKMRIEKFSGLNGDSLLRLIGDELPSNPFLESAVEEYLDASGDREALKSSRAAIEQEVSAIRSLLKTKLEMAEHELSIAKAIRENKQDSLMDERKKMAEYDASRRDYDRQLAALDNLEQRQLDARLSSAQSVVPRVSLALTNTSLVDAMTYVLQLAGLDYHLRKNTVVVGTPSELKALH